MGWAGRRWESEELLRMRQDRRCGECWDRNGNASQQPVKSLMGWMDISTNTRNIHIYEIYFNENFIKHMVCLSMERNIFHNFLHFPLRWLVVMPLAAVVALTRNPYDTSIQNTNESWYTHIKGDEIRQERDPTNHPPPTPTNQILPSPSSLLSTGWWFFRATTSVF